MRRLFFILSALVTFIIMMATATPALADDSDLVLPNLYRPLPGLGISCGLLLWIGFAICLAGIGFGLHHFRSIRALPVHKSMKDVSELIYKTCKTYMITQGKFLAILWIPIATIMVVYFGFLSGHHVKGGEDISTVLRVAIIIAFSIVGVLGSYAVAWFGMRINTYANSRTAFASLEGRAQPVSAIPMRSGISIGMLLISIELIIMLFIMLVIPGSLAGACFIGFAIGESLGAAVLRIAGGIFTKIADVGADMMKIIFDLGEDDAKNPGVIADCTGDNAGDSVGPTADGFETYGVTGVALITFILLAMLGGPDKEMLQVQMLVWIFVMRVGMIVTSALSYGINCIITKVRYGSADHFDFEAPLTNLVWLTSFVSIAMTFLLSYVLIPNVGGDTSLWWKLSVIITCGTLAGAIIPELVKVFTSTNSRHVKEVVQASKKGGASLNIISGLVAGNLSVFWLVLAIIILMAGAYGVSNLGLETIMNNPEVFAFGLVAFGFLGMGPVTIAVDSYGPVTDNAQSVFELSTVETIPGIEEDIKKNFGFIPNFKKAKDLLEENDGAGNTFKATAKPVLIGTAVVGATTLIFSIIQVLKHTPAYQNVEKGLSILNPLFLFGLIWGGAVIFWFSGAAIQAVSTGAYRAIEFIQCNIKLDKNSPPASEKDSKKVVEICTQYAQKGMLNIFLAVFFGTLACAFLHPFFFIAYLISIAIVGLYQAIFMANAGGAWDNAKKIVETLLKQKGTELHKACVVGDTVGDPFKDTSSVALNPIIKFTTLFGLLAVELAITIPSMVRFGLSGAFFLVMLVFVYRSFYGMRIKSDGQESD